MGRVGPMELLLLVAILGVPLVAVALLLGWVRAVARRGAARRQHEQALRANREPHRAPPPERERVIERQVIVTRCKFCQNLTPVDLSACKECGAKL